MTRSPSRCFLTGGLQDNNMKHLVKTVRGLVGAGYPQPSRRPRHEASTRDPVSGGDSSPAAPCGLWSVPRHAHEHAALPAETPPGAAAPAPDQAPAPAPDLAQQVQNLEARVAQLESQSAQPQSRTVAPAPEPSPGPCRPPPPALPRPRPLQPLAPGRKKIIPKACASIMPRNMARPRTSSTST